MTSRIETISRDQQWMPSWWGWHMIFWGLIALLLTAAFMVRTDMTVEQYKELLVGTSAIGAFLSLLHGFGKAMVAGHFD